MSQKAFMAKLVVLILFTVTNVTGKTSLRNYDASDCGPCQGGMTTLTLQYVGTETASVIIKGARTFYFSGVVSPNQFITVSGTRSNSTFEDNQISLLINGKVDAKITINCTQPISVNTAYGKFLLTAGASREGGPLCCGSNTSDTTPPVIQNCPQDIQVTLDKGQCTQIVTWTPPTASDDCALGSLTSTHSSGESFPVGTTSIVYTAADASGNKTTCTFQVVVKDDQNPVFQNCPTDIVANTSGTTAIVKWGALTASDNCGNVNITSTHSSGDQFNIGTTPVSYTASDNAGNTTSCNFTVTVRQVNDNPGNGNQGNGNQGNDNLVHIATFMTPDGDGINDVWTIGNIDRYTQNSVTIVDRWGTVIFTASPYNSQRAWDGTDPSGKKVVAGTYFYSLNLGNGAEIKRGFIEVIH